MSDHYVRHMLGNGGYVSTEFECRAAENGSCRTFCQTCWGEQRECCQCEFVDPPRTPNITSGHPCQIVIWLQEDAPEECFNGDPQPVRGPDWQPIVPEWNGDNYDWDYAS